MPLEKKYDATPLQVLTDTKTRQRIRRLHRVTGRSQAQIMRDLIDFGLPKMEAMWGIDDIDE